MSAEISSARPEVVSPYTDDGGYPVDFCPAASRVGRGGLGFMQHGGSGSDADAPRRAATSETCPSGPKRRTRHTVVDSGIYLT
jgi:hypothetical protein